MSAESIATPIDFEHGRVDMSHGGGGRVMAQLIEELFLPAFDNPLLRQGNDQAAFSVEAGRMVMSTDGYVISPLFFPGGDIGSLAVHGTINDVAMAGAVPVALSASYIIEEGLPLATLREIVQSMGRAAAEAGVPIVTGDTKVVEKGKGDGLFISTTGIGRVPAGINISGDKASPGDVIIVSGTMGDHGMTIMSQRESLGFGASLKSDSASLHRLVASMVAASSNIHCLRDPTRGGLASTLNELARQSKVGMMLKEKSIPIRPEVQGACELLGLDPLYVANEGKLIAILPAADADKVLAAMRADPHGKDAAVIGEIIADDHYFVQMETAFGGRRIVDWLAGEQLPRIC